MSSSERGIFMVAKVKALWQLVPHRIQAVIVGVVMAFIGAVVNAYETNACMTVVCIRHYAMSAVVTGLSSIYVFYMKPSGSNSPPVLKG